MTSQQLTGNKTKTIQRPDPGVLCSCCQHFHQGFNYCYGEDPLFLSFDVRRERLECSNFLPKHFNYRTEINLYWTAIFMELYYEFEHCYGDFTYRKLVREIKELNERGDSIRIPSFEEFHSFMDLIGAFDYCKKERWKTFCWKCLHKQAATNCETINCDEMKPTLTQNGAILNLCVDCHHFEEDKRWQQVLEKETTEPESWIMSYYQFRDLLLEQCPTFAIPEEDAYRQYVLAIEKRHLEQIISNRFFVSEEEAKKLGRRKVTRKFGRIYYALNSRHLVGNSATERVVERLKEFNEFAKRHNLLWRIKLKPDKKGGFSFLYVCFEDKEGRRFPSS